MVEDRKIDDSASTCMKTTTDFADSTDFTDSTDFNIMRIAQ